MPNKFYIICVTQKNAGIGAILFQILTHIKYAFEQGYIPIVDLKHYQNQYFKDGMEYRDNAWEYFFEQPTEYNLDNIPEDAEIIFSTNTKRPKGVKNIISPQLINKKIDSKIQNEKEEYKKLIKFKPDIIEYMQNSYQEIIGGENDVLGILCRGTDFIKKRPKNEPIQPEPKVVIKKAKELLKKYNYKKIYLATEDAEIYQIFKKEFGDMILDNNQYRYSDNYDKNCFLYEIKVDRKDHNYNLAKEYLASLYILSKCRYLIGGQTSGTKVVGLLTEGFDYGYIWQLGAYGKENILIAYLEQYIPVRKIFSIKDTKDKKHKIITIFGHKINTKDIYSIMDAKNKKYKIITIVGHEINTKDVKNFIQNVFSIKNKKRKDDTKHKVITILGIKLKIKIK